MATKLLFPIAILTILLTQFKSVELVAEADDGHTVYGRPRADSMNTITSFRTALEKRYIYHHVTSNGITVDPGQTTKAFARDIAEPRIDMVKEVSADDILNQLSKQSNVRVIFCQGAASASMYEQRLGVSRELLGYGVNRPSSVPSFMEYASKQNVPILFAEINCKNMAVGDQKNVIDVLSRTELKELTISNIVLNNGPSPAEKVKPTNLEKLKLILDGSQDILDFYFKFKMDLSAIKQLEIIDYHNPYQQETLFIPMYVSFVHFQSLSELILDVDVTYSESLADNLKKMKNLKAFGIITITAAQLYEFLICKIPRVKTFYARCEVVDKSKHETCALIKGAYSNIESVVYSDDRFVITCKLNENNAKLTPSIQCK